MVKLQHPNENAAYGWLNIFVAHMLILLLIPMYVGMEGTLFIRYLSHCAVVKTVLLTLLLEQSARDERS